MPIKFRFIYVAKVCKKGENYVKRFLICEFTKTYCYTELEVGIFKYFNILKAYEN